MKLFISKRCVGLYEYDFLLKKCMYTFFILQMLQFAYGGGTYLHIHILKKCKNRFIKHFCDF